MVKGRGKGVDAPLGTSTPWATGRSSLLGKRTRVKEREGRVRPEERGTLPFRGWIHASAHFQPASAGMTEKTGGGGNGRSRTVAQRRRRRLYRCVLSATADVPHRRRLCDSPVLLRGRGRDARWNLACGAVSTTRSARPPHGDVGAWTPVTAAVVAPEISEG